MHRIYVEKQNFFETHIRLDSDTWHHLVRVCKIRMGDYLELVLDSNHLVTVTITDTVYPELYVTVTDYQKLGAIRSIPVIIIQSLPKNDKLATVCRLCTEMGVADYYPVVSDRCLVRELSPNKCRRVQAVIDSAAKQSKHTCVPTLHNVDTLDDFLKNHDFSSGLKIVAYEQASIGLAQAVLPSSYNRIYVAIGPEGGYTEQDMHLFESAGFHAIRLGDAILRTEHAAFAAINQLDGYMAAVSNT